MIFSELVRRGKWMFLRDFPGLALLSVVCAAALYPAMSLAENPGAVSQPFEYDLQLASADFSIPPVVDRPDPFDLEAGPELDINRIEAYEVEVTGGSTKRKLVTDGGFNAIIREYVSRRQGRFTFGVLQELANQLTGYLRQQDNLLANVYVPSQQVENGVVRLDVLMGKLGEVEVRGNSHISSSAVRQAFAAAEGRNVERAQIEESMLILQEYPGISVGGTFMPGQSLGETRLVIDVNEEDRFEPSFLTDNYGSDSTGRIRYGVRAVINNPLNLLDTLSLDGVMVQKPDNANVEDTFHDRVYGGLRYEMRPVSSRWGLGVKAYINSYTVGDTEGLELSAAEITGETINYSFFVSHKLHRTRTSKIDLEAGLTIENAVTRFRGLEGNRDDLSYLDLKLSYQANDNFFGGGVNIANIRIVQGIENFLGSMGNGSEPHDVPTSRSIRVPAELIGCQPQATAGCVPEFTAEGQRFIDGAFLKTEYNLLRYQRLGVVNALVNISGQLTQDPLAAVQESGIGGPYNVRAYPTGSFLADRTLFTTFEVIKPFFDNKLQLSLFYDIGNGKNFESNRNEPDEITLEGYGIGIRFQYGKFFSTNLTAAWATGPDRDIPISGASDGNGNFVFGRDAAGRDEPMIYFSLLASF